MVLLTISIAVPGDHARLARLETGAPSCIAAAIGTAVGCRIGKMMVHFEEDAWYLRVLSGQVQTYCIHNEPLRIYYCRRVVAVCVLLST
jgi:hypothetical protein